MDELGDFLFPPENTESHDLFDFDQEATIGFDEMDLESVPHLKRSAEDAYLEVGDASDQEKRSRTNSMEPLPPDAPHFDMDFAEVVEILRQYEDESDLAPEDGHESSPETQEPILSAERETGALHSCVQRVLAKRLMFFNKTLHRAPEQDLLLQVSKDTVWQQYRFLSFQNATVQLPAHAQEPLFCVLFVLRHGEVVQYTELDLQGKAPSKMEFLNEDNLFKKNEAACVPMHQCGGRLSNGVVQIVTQTPHDKGKTRTNTFGRKICSDRTSNAYTLCAVFVYCDGAMRSAVSRPFSIKSKKNLKKNQFYTEEELCTGKRDRFVAESLGFKLD